MANQNATYTIVLATFNNYFTRKVRNIRDLAGTSYTDVVNYLVTNVIPYQAIDGINFKYKDGVNTRLVSLEVPNQAYSADMFNYVFVFGSDKVLKHCWFIMEAMLDSGTKHTFTLKRDLVVDYFSDIKTLPMFVQKGLLQDDDPMIYNKEGMSFNQIKIRQDLLKEKNQDTPWIVAYLDSKFTEITATELTAIPYNKDYIDIDQFNLHLQDPTSLVSGAKIYSLNKPLNLLGKITETLGPFDHNNVNLRANYNLLSEDFTLTGFDVVKNYQGTFGNNDSFARVNYPNLNAKDWLRAYRENILYFSTSIKQAIKNYMSNDSKSPVSSQDLSTILSLQGSIVYSSSQNKYFRISSVDISNNTVINDIKLTPNGNTASLNSIMTNVCSKTASDMQADFVVLYNPYHLYWVETEYNISFEEVLIPGSIKTTVSNTRNHLADAPFDMLCLPYTPINLQLIQNLVLKLSNNVYDVQIVPYCPGRFMMVNGVITRIGSIAAVDYSIIYEKQENLWVDSGTEIIYCRSSSDKFNIDYEMVVDNPKIESETKTVRIVSCNHSSAFELSPAKNGGIDGFVVSYSYKPYSPYIHVKPLFKNLYGTTFPCDSRGITFVGDFSIDMISDKWADFQIQNKNYQATFNNEIQTMDKMNQLDLISNIGSSQMNALASGVAVGGMTGNAYAGIAAGVASSVGGVVDVGLGQEKYRLNKQLKISQFEYQLGNIKALPRTISKVTAYCIDNLYFPYVEVYDATDVEKQALRDKINYDGMTVMRIGTIEEFLGGRSDYDLNFFKAEMITLPYDMTGDYHEVNELALMLEKGVYL